MHDAFGTVLWIVCITGAILAVIALIASQKTWEDFGKDRLTLDSELRRAAGKLRVQRQPVLPEVLPGLLAGDQSDHREDCAGDADDPEDCPERIVHPQSIVAPGRGFGGISADWAISGADW